MTPLDEITNWRERAVQARYDWLNLARNCGVCPRHLSRYFVLVFYKAPQQWLNEIRLWEAARYLAQGARVKEVAANLNFKRLSHFSKAFRNYHRVAPSRYAQFYQELETRRNELAVKTFRPDPVPASWRPAPVWEEAEWILSQKHLLRHPPGMRRFNTARSRSY